MAAANNNNDNNNNNTNNNNKKNKQNTEYKGIISLGNQYLTSKWFVISSNCAETLFLSPQTAL